MKPKDHIVVLGALHIAWNMFLLVAALLVLVLPALAVATQDEDFGIVVAVIAVVASTLMFVFAIGGIVGAVGILKRRRWARYVLMVLGAVWAIKVPVGTALGVYTFYVLTRDEVVGALDSPTQHATLCVSE